MSMGYSMLCLHLSIKTPTNDGTEDEAEEYEDAKIELGPQCSLKEQLEKDKVCFFLIFC